MNLLGILLHLFVTIFNRLSSSQKKIYFEIGENYQIEMNVSSLFLKNIRNKNYTNQDCALIPLKDQPKHKPI